MKKEDMHTKIGYGQKHASQALFRPTLHSTSYWLKLGRAYEVARRK